MSRLLRRNWTKADKSSSCETNRDSKTGSPSFKDCPTTLALTPLCHKLHFGKVKVVVGGKIEAILPAKWKNYAIKLALKTPEKEGSRRWKARRGKNKAKKG